MKIIKNWAPTLIEQQFRIQGSSGVKTGDWSKIQFCSTRINYILKYIKIENGSFKLQYMTVLLHFCSLCTIAIYWEKK